MMAILIISFGLFMIGLGFLIKKYPNLIAGYNTMSKERKEQVDITGLSTFMCNGFIIIGLLCIGGYSLFKLIGLDLIAECIPLILLLLGVPIFVVKAQKYDHNKPNKYKFIHVILAIVIAFIVGMLVYGIIPTKVIIGDSSVEITGMYGCSLKAEDIDKVEFLDSIPEITMRTNGFSLGLSKKGYFNLKEFGNCRLFIASKTPAYLLITTKDGEKIIVNHKYTSETTMQYKAISTMIRP